MGASPNRMVGVIFGAVYVVIGVAGFFVPTQGGLLLGTFEVNPLHNVVHILIGAALLIAGLASVRAARTVNGVVGTGYLVLGILGLFIIGSPFNILAINGADNVLHFGSATLLLAVGLGSDRGTRIAAAG